MSCLDSEGGDEREDHGRDVDPCGDDSLVCEHVLDLVDGPHEEGRAADADDVSERVEERKLGRPHDEEGGQDGEEEPDAETDAEPVHALY